MLDNTSSTPPDGRMDTPYVPILVPAVASTQEEARRRFDGIPVLVTTRRQTEGRGRTGAAWVHADRAVAASLAFRPSWLPDTWTRLPLVAGLAALDALPAGPRLAWPNDVILGGLKIGGLIAESDGSVVVAGLGLNLFWSDPIPGAGALLADDPGDQMADRIAADWAERLLDRLDCDPADWGRAEYVAVSATIGYPVTWEPEGSGIAVDIDAGGALVVDTAAGRVTLDSGVVRRVRQEG